MLGIAVIEIYPGPIKTCLHDGEEGGVIGKGENDTEAEGQQGDDNPARVPLQPVGETKEEEEVCHRLHRRVFEGIVGHELSGCDPAQALYHQGQTEQLKDPVPCKKGPLHIEGHQSGQHYDGLADVGDQLNRILEQGVTQNIQEDEVAERLAVKDAEKIVTRR